MFLKAGTSFFCKNLVGHNISEIIRRHSLRNSNTVLGTHRAIPDVLPTIASSLTTEVPTAAVTFRNFFQTTATTAATVFNRFATTLKTTTTNIPCKYVLYEHVYQYI